SEQGSGVAEPGGILVRPPSVQAGRMAPATTNQAGLMTPATTKFVVTIGDTIETVEVSGQAPRYRVTIGSEVWEVDGRLTAQGIYSLLIGGASHVADVPDEGGTGVVDVGAERYVLPVQEA